MTQLWRNTHFMVRTRCMTNAGEDLGAIEVLSYQAREIPSYKVTISMLILPRDLGLIRYAQKHAMTELVKADGGWLLKTL